MTIKHFHQAGTDTDWQQVVAGSYHSIGLKDDGSLWGCGFNTEGELGLGYAKHVLKLKKMLTDPTMQLVSLSCAHMMILKGCFSKTFFFLLL